MRFPSGVTDQYIYFVAVDSTDYVTRETGLSSFTVYRARNGAAAAAYTTPTVAEVSSANMPGVYSLLLDEDMTIGSGNDSEEVVLHITQASMAPVTIKYELYRNVVTAGETLTVASGIGDADVEKWLGQTVAAVTVNGVPEVDVTHWRGTAAAAPTVAGVPAVEVIDMSAAGQTDVRAAVGLASANLDTQLSTIDDFLDTEVATIVSQTTAANIRAAVGLASANLDTQIGDIPTNAELATSQAAADDATLAAIAALSIPTAAVIADAVWDEAIAGHLTAGTTGATLNGAGSAGDPWSTALPGAYAAGTAGKIVGDNINATISSRASQASLDTVDDLLDTEIASIIASIGTVENLGTGATLAKNLRDIGGATFDSTTDTLEAVRNRVVTIDALLDTEIAAILADTNELQTDWVDGGRLDLLIDAINAKTTNLPSDPADASVIAGRFDTLDTSVADLPTNAELATALAAADDAVLAAIAALNNLSAAQVNAEVVDALATDTYAEPGQGNPASTASLADKVGYLYKVLRNKSTVTSGVHSIFADDATTVDHKRTVSDDGTTFTSGELATGP